MPERDVIPRLDTKGLLEALARGPRKTGLFVDESEPRLMVRFERLRLYGVATMIACRMEILSLQRKAVAEK